MIELKEYGITEKDFFVDDQFKLITRSGIQKIKRYHNIQLAFKVEHIDQVVFNNQSDHAVFMSGTGTLIHRGASATADIVKTVQATASATPRNCTFDYKIEMCEKRLESRIVLELSGLDGWMSEDEVSISNNPATLTRAKKGNSALSAAVNKLKSRNTKDEPMGKVRAKPMAKKKP